MFLAPYWKSIAAGVVAFVSTVLTSLPDSGAPSNQQWLAAAVAGVIALNAVWLIPNKQVQAVATLAEDAAKAKVAPAVHVTYNGVPVTASAPASIPTAAPIADAGPITPAPLVEPGSDPVSPPAYGGPIPPVSEPVGATAVSAP